MRRTWSASTGPRAALSRDARHVRGIGCVPVIGALAPCLAPTSTLSEPETRVSSTYRSQAYPVRRPIGPRRSTAGWLAVIVFAFLAGIGIIGAFAAISVYAAISSNLPDPVKGLS